MGLTGAVVNVVSPDEIDYEPTKGWEESSTKGKEKLHCRRNRKDKVERNEKKRKVKSSSMYNCCV